MILKYFLNCFLLLVPIFVWNIIFYKALPKAYQADVFWKDIPSFLNYSENILRIIVFVMPLFMILKVKSDLQKTGLTFYLIGVVVYFSVWCIQIYYPNSVWSKSAMGFTAPAYTTILWLLGIGFIGNQSFVNIPHLSKIYVVASVLFVVFHTYHSYIVYRSLY